MSVIHNDLLLATDEATGYKLTKSLRLRSSASAYLSRTLGTPTNGAVWTFSAWVKRGSIGVSQEIMTSSNGSTNQCNIEFTSGDKLRIINYIGSTFKTQYVTTQVFRDPSAWYHIVIRQNSSTGFTVYVNGQSVAAFDTATGPDASEWLINQNGRTVNIGREQLGGVNYFDGYIAELNFIDGQALTPSSFGETDSITGVWKPKAYTGTYGTNGFYLPFTDVATTSGSNAGLGKDFSGNGNYWNTNNISVTSGSTYDSMTDVPTLTSATAANYAVANPLQSTTAPTDANLKLSGVSPSTWYATVSSIGISSGKYYFEVYANSLNNTNQSMHIGIVGVNYSVPTGSYIGNTSTSWGYRQDGTVYNNGSSSAYGASFNGGDTIGVALDMDNGTLVFYKNNTSQGTATTGLSGTYFPAFSVNNGGTGTVVGSINFGQQPFAYTPPTGYKALNTYNLPDSTIVAGNKVMDATTWTGDGTSSRAIVNAGGFKPDLVWIKDRSQTYNNLLYNSISGVSNGTTSKSMSSNQTGYEGQGNDDSTYGYLSSFNSNGFGTVKGSTGAYTNNSGDAYVAWQWQAGQGTTSSNTSGSITSTVSVNASAGFSIVTYTGNGTAGATFGHGLGVAPAFVIIKKRSATGDWQAYHQSIGNTGAVFPNLTIGTYTTILAWNNTSPTSSVMSLGSGADVNGSGQTFVAYCWAEVAGFSKFSSYVGNGTNDGPFIYTGFRPKYIMIKRTNGAESWIIKDSSRANYNATNTANLFANNSNAEDTYEHTVDFLSNGFKVRTPSYATVINGNGDSYIYIAFAENPFRNSLAR